MNLIKKISLFTIALLIFSQTQCSESKSAQDLEFPEYTTEKYIYHKDITTQDHGSIYTSIFGKHPNGVSVTDNTYEDMLSNRVTRKRVEKITENGVTIITTQTWKSRNPSYLTWVNGALVVAAIAGIVLGSSIINTGGNVASAHMNSQAQVQSAGINAFGNIGAAGTNAIGNISTEFIKASPETQKTIFKGIQEANDSFAKNVQNIGNIGVEFAKTPSEQQNAFFSGMQQTIKTGADEAKAIIAKAQELNPNIVSTK